MKKHVVAVAALLLSSAAFAQSSETKCYKVDQLTQKFGMADHKTWEAYVKSVQTFTDKSLKLQKREFAIAEGNEFLKEEGGQLIGLQTVVKARSYGPGDTFGTALYRYVVVINAKTCTLSKPPTLVFSEKY